MSNPCLLSSGTGARGLAPRRRARLGSQSSAGMGHFLFETRLAATVALAIAASCACAILCGCSPVIGDHCALSTDCSVQGTRICDTSQPNGYCTLLSCTANTCPDNAACVEFGASVQGCSYDDYAAPSRTGRSMCMKRCTSSSDCRQAEGYGCFTIGPSQTPWTVILDTSQSSGVCMIGGSSPVDAQARDAAVCSWNRLDSSSIDAPRSDEPAGEAGGADTSTLESGADGADAPPDAPQEADAIDESADASQEAGNDAAQDAAGGTDATGDAPADQTLTGTPDSGAIDAPAGN
ncbi:MAG: hypothetical protein M3O46_07080 [Myxococcota bacterium]|nr:hypothetical protein [Myxococcota bacterium]